jgi:hypothetical protein
MSPFVAGAFRSWVADDEVRAAAGVLDACADGPGDPDSSGHSRALAGYRLVDGGFTAAEVARRAGRGAQHV